KLGVTITYSAEEEILGTSGALDRVRGSLLDDDFVVINGKIVTDIDLSLAIAEHRSRNALATLVLKENTAREHFSIVEIDGRGWITRFAGFPDAAPSEAASVEATGIPGGVLAKSEHAPWMFTGIQVLSPRIFDYIPRDRFSHSTVHVYPRAIAAGEAVIAHISSSDWYEMSTLSRYLEASLRFMGKAGQSIVTGKRCVIEDGARVEEAVLWDRVRIENGARVKRAVLGDDVRIRAGAVIERSVVVRRDIVKEIDRGMIVDDNLVVPI
ncbi:MAG TPA: NDP-sugar synthase, partial [Blastocatellia bacterium]|nr:NDP-sugar synthase [Blastocatellia bacterium]